MFVVFYCDMDLRYFPMDWQICKMDLESYGNNIKNLNYFWDDPAVAYAADFSLPNFRKVCYFSQKDDSGKKFSNFSN